VIAALEAITEKKVEAVVGKPSPITVQVILEIMGLRPEECLLIGDRLETDIRMGLESGMKTALVMTGITTPEILEASPLKPDYVFQGIAGVEDLLRKGKSKF
jgi:arabinose operon protein AraL